MKQSLQLRLGQHLTMTPQLQQAIRLLQLSSLELRNEIQEALETNPMLEDVAEEAQKPAADDSAGSEGSEQIHANDVDRFEDIPDDSANRDASLDMQKSDMPDDLPTDSAWEDSYDLSTSYSGPAPDDELRGMENRGSEESTLSEHLQWQMNLTPYSETDRVIATAIIDSINEDGYLTGSLEEIYEDLKEEMDIEFDEVNAVLHSIQNYDPPGVGARDLRENLAIQLRQLNGDIRWLAEARELVNNYFDLLANREYNQLARRMKLTTDDLTEVFQLIHSLNPRPGNQIASAHAEYVVPDVFVRKMNGKWVVKLNGEATPRLKINSYYAGMIQRADKSADNTYLQGQLQEARWFLKSLQSRSETLLKVAKCIVERQEAFLEHGDEAMKALVLHDVAESVGMHESTISRITTKKYMHTPRGIFELKYFFSSHVATDSGGECSSTAIRALIKKMVSNEEARKPLSDSKIASLLAEQGIQVARRTVAKYRDALAIPPSNERKRLA